MLQVQIHHGVLWYEVIKSIWWWKVIIKSGYNKLKLNHKKEKNGIVKARNNTNKNIWTVDEVS